MILIIHIIMHLIFDLPILASIYHLSLQYVPTSLCQKPNSPVKCVDMDAKFCMEAKYSVIPLLCIWSGYK